MPTRAIETATKMLESLPESDQEQVVEHLREYIAELRDEMRWDSQFERSQSELASAARRARKMKGDAVTWFWIGGHDEYERFFS